MYGARSARPVVAREGIPFSQLSMMPRKPGYGGANDNNTRASRGKAIVDDDIRLGSSRGDIRVRNSSGTGGMSRGSVEHTDRHRSDDISPYATMTERRGFRDDLTVWKMVAGADEAPLRAEGGGRFRDGTSSRGERVSRPAAYSDDAKLVRNGTYDTVSYDGGAGSLRDVDYLPVTKTTAGVRAILPGFIFECPKRSILDFSSHKGSFVLPLDDRRFAEQVGPSTKIFMFDGTARELHGVFQAESYSLRVPQGPARVHVRVAKECIPLTERQFKEILHENYYTHSKFSENLSKEQVMKLLQTFRPVDAARSVHVSLPTSRRTLDSGLSHSGQEFHSISDEIVYRKEERWRSGTVDTRSLSGHSYHSQEATRFSSKVPAQSLSAKSLDDYEDYGDDEGIEDLPVSTSRLITGSSPYSTSRVKQQSLRSVSGSRTSIGHLVGNVGHSELKLAEANWREDVDPRELLFKKRQAVSPSPDDLLKRRGLSSSPPWKDVHPMVEAAVDEMYDRPVKGGYKEESSYLSSRRRRHSDIDLNVPLEMGHGEPAHLHDVKSKGVRRKVWDDEEGKGYSLSPPKGRSVLRGSSSFQISDHLLTTDAVDDYDDDSRLDSRHMVSSSRIDYPLLRTEEKGRPVSSSFSNGKFGKPHPRAVTMKTYSKDKPVVSPIIRKRPLPGRDSYGKEPTLRGTKAPVFQIKANLQTPGRGKSERVVTMLDERVVTMVDKDSTRSWGTEGISNGGSSSQGRKRKPSVWSRLSFAGKGLGQKGAAMQHGRGRVFSRLGPSMNASFERRDDTYGHKNKKPRQQQTQIKTEDDSERFENLEKSPDALEGEDYLNDDHDAEGSDKGTEKAAGDLQGWTRKKASVVNSGADSGNPDHGEYANGKGGRRKLVRPSIGAKDQADDSGWKRTVVTGDDREDTHAQLRRRSGSMDVDMANMEARETADDSPGGSRHDLNSLLEDYHPDFEEDNMMSS